MPHDPLRSERLEALLADCQNEWEQLAALETYLEDQLEFPLRAVCDVPPEHGSYGIGEGDRVTILGFLEPDKRWGIMVRVRKGQRVYRCPLFRLKPWKSAGAQQIAVDDYRTWFNAVGLPEIVDPEE
ncbi:MAG TPA: calcium-binding protein [Alphaproteobacteria bacterium]|nr:calcium-binding protein [Alphaproteobacteria bacterium]